MGNFMRAIGLAFNLSDIFINFPLHKLKISCKECERLTGDPHRNKLAQKIFKDHMKLVIEDVIENNTTFILPTGTRHAEIHVKPYRGEEFKNFRRKGKWKGVDFLKSWFTGHQICLFMKSPKRPDRIKNIYVNSEMTRRIDELTNEGKQYC